MISDFVPLYTSPLVLRDGSSFIHSSVPVQETFDGYARADFAGKV
jgi:hypothetical protein